jgi:hypothetical protein
MGPDVRSGRVNADLIRECVADLTEALFFVCGPAISAWDRAAAREKGIEPQPRFLESVLSALESLGLPKLRITRESCG